MKVRLRIDFDIDDRSKVVTMKLSETFRVGSGRHAYDRQTAASTYGQFRLGASAARELGERLIAIADHFDEPEPE